MKNLTFIRGAPVNGNTAGPSHRRVGSTGALIAAIIAVAMVLRLIAIWWYGPTAIKFGDGPDYLSAAQSICAGYYPERSSLPFFRAPGLPLFISAVTGCHISDIFTIKLALALMGALTVGLIFALTDEMFRDRRAGFIASAISALYPFFIMQSADIESESLFMFLFVASVWLSLRTDNRASMLLAGLTAAAAALTRPVALLLALLAPIRVVTLHAGSRAQRYRSLLFYYGAFVCCMAPWVLRNEVRFHEFILVNDAGGYNFWRGTSPEMAQINRLADSRAFAAASSAFETEVTPRTAREVELSAHTPGERSRGWYRLAYQNFLTDPSGFVGRVLGNAWAYWRPWLNPVTASPAAVAASAVIVTLLYLLGGYGWLLLFRRDQRLAYWLLFFVLVFWLSQIPFQVVSRFRVPIADPFLMALAGASVSYILKRVSSASHPA